MAISIVTNAPKAKRSSGVRTDRGTDLIVSDKLSLLQLSIVEKVDNLSEDGRGGQVQLGRRRVQLKLVLPNSYERNDKFEKGW